MYLVPLILAVIVFLIATAGYFMTDGKKEMLYGVCSIMCAACAVVQLALIF